MSLEQVHQGWRDTTQATKFGIVYDKTTKEVLVIHLPDKDEELERIHLPSNAAIHHVQKGDSDIHTCRKIVSAL